MRYEIRLTNEAAQNVRDVAAWYAQQSPAAAERWYAGFQQEIATLSECPERFPLARENHRLPIELRQLNYGSGRRTTHRILFAIRPTAVIIYAVRHAAQQDWRPDDDLPSQNA